MTVASATFTPNGYPNGTDNSQRRQKHYGGGVVPTSVQNGVQVTNGVTWVGSSPSYVQGGVRINFSGLENIKASAPNLLPQWCRVYSLSGSGYVYVYNPLGPQITNLALTSNVVTITCKNNLAAGDVVMLSGLTVTTALNGVTLTVLAGSLSATQFTANLTAGNISTAFESGYCTPISYATGKPFQGNLQIFQSAGSAAALAELSTTSLPAGVVGSASVNADLIGWTAEFVRV